MLEEDPRSRCPVKRPSVKHSIGGQPDSTHRPTASNPAPVFGQRAMRIGRPHRSLEAHLGSARRCQRRVSTDARKSL